LGEIADRIVAAGGSALLTEVPEMFGAETILMNRANDEATFHKLVGLINDFKDYFLRTTSRFAKIPLRATKRGASPLWRKKILGLHP
jgi:altronate hydrolase